ncbi:MAG: hypothetical protein MUC79_09980 [Thiobacillaceae bacterium]|jgi:hypothetical protein|nr:hypothetical protein [Thiobacillaceae bacterium]
MRADDLLSALHAALSGDWHRAHAIVQRDEADPTGCWIDAVLHKIEGDCYNSRYWYARTSHEYGEWADTRAELAAIRRAIAESGV